MSTTIPNNKYQPIAWHVVFYGRRRHNWWDLFSEPALRHVACYGYVSSFDAWVVFDARDFQTVVAVVPWSQIDDLRLLWGGAPSVHLLIDAKTCPVHAHRVGQWCSTAVARVVGVRGSAWRPWALLKTLLQENAEVVATSCPSLRMRLKKIPKRNVGAK